MKQTIFRLKELGIKGFEQTVVFTENSEVFAFPFLRTHFSSAVKHCNIPVFAVRCYSSVSEAQDKKENSSLGNECKWTSLLPNECFLRECQSGLFLWLMAIHLWGAFK